MNEEKDRIWLDAEDACHLDDAINHLFGVVRLRDVHLTPDEAKALRVLADKVGRYRGKNFMFEILEKVRQEVKNEKTSKQ